MHSSHLILMHFWLLPLKCFMATCIFCKFCESNVGIISWMVFIYDTYLIGCIIQHKSDGQVPIHIQLVFQLNILSLTRICSIRSYITYFYSWLLFITLSYNHNEICDLLLKRDTTLLQTAKLSASGIAPAPHFLRFLMFMGHQ